MSTGPKMYIVTTSACDGFKKYNLRTHVIGNIDSFTALLTPMSFDTEQEVLNNNCNLTTSVVFKGSSHISLL